MKIRNVPCQLAEIKCYIKILQLTIILFQVTKIKTMKTEHFSLL